MHEPTVTDQLEVFDVLWLGDDTSNYGLAVKSFEKLSLVSHFIVLNEALQSFSSLKQRVIVCEIKDENFKTAFECLDRIKAINPASSVIVLAQNLQMDMVDRLINQVDAFSILQPKDNLVESVKKAIEDYKNKSFYFNNLKKVKQQNEKLESLNKNLEKLVHERTRKEFEANQMTLGSLKDIQGILKFIKAISRAETIEDLMNEVRGDFKRFHGLMPPILILLEPTGRLRFFYFQGKQFTEKVHTSSQDVNFFKEKGISNLRSGLSNLLGRPFGPVNVTDLSFRSLELQNLMAKVVCEHSFNDKNLDEFDRYSLERWSIINMALENILLKEKAHEIAKQWAKTFNETKDPIIIIDSNYKVTLSNSSYHRDIEKELEGNQDKKDMSFLYGAAEQTFISGESQTADINFLGVIYRVHSYPIRLIGEERVSHVINQYIDITKSIDLQSRVIQGEKMAAIGLLAGNIAHELNNPLTGIYSLSGLLLDDIEKETNTYKDLVEVRDAAGRCQRIIKDLLEFSSVGADSKTGIVNINEMISKTLPLLKMAMRTHNCEIILSDENLLVEFNPQLLQQVIFNLVNNACQAMDEGGTLKVESILQEDRCLISVRDTGPGVPEEIKELIFDPFFTTKEEGEGTGLGLSMSRSVVERFNGHLILKDNTDVGSEFIISLPRVEK